MRTATLPTSSFTLDIPTIDISRFKGIVRAMGWHIRKQSPIEESLQEIEEGKVYKYASLDNFIKEIEG